MKSKSDMHIIEIECKLRYRTEKAMQIDVGNKDYVWIPLSQIEDEGVDTDGNLYSIFIPDWLALEKGLI